MSKNKQDVIKFFSIKIFVGIIGFLSISAYSYLLDSSIYGQYSLILGIIQVFIEIIIGWVGSSALRYYDTYKEDEKSFFSNLIVQWICTLGLAIIVTIIFSRISTTIPVSQYLALALLLLISLGTSGILEKTLRGAKKTNLYIVIVLLQNILNLALFYCFAKYLNLDIYAIFWSNIISNAFFIIFAIFTFKIYKKFDFKLISWKFQKKFLKYGIPMIGVWGMSWIMHYSDRYLINFFYSSTEVGIYDIAYRITESSINMIVNSLQLAMFPILISTWNTKGKEETEEQMGKILDYFSLLVIPAIFGLIGIRKNLYGTVLGENYSSGANVIMYIAISSFFLGFNNFIYKFWQLKEKTNKILIFMIISVIVNIGLNIIFIPIYGFEVAAITTLISYFISTILVIVFTIKEFKIKLNILKLLLICFSSIIMYIFIYLMQRFISNLFMLILVIIFSIVIYIILITIFGLVNEEKEIIINLITKKFLKGKKMKNKFDIKDIFIKLNKENIKYILLRGYIPIKEIYESQDIDIYVKKEDRKKLKKILLDNNWKISKINTTRYPHEQYNILVDNRIYKLDIVYGIYYTTSLKHFKYENKILQGTRKREDINIPNTITALILFCLHILYDKGILTEKNKVRLKSMYNDYLESNKDTIYLTNIFTDYFENIIQQMCEDTIENTNYKIKTYIKDINNLNLLKSNIFRNIFCNFFTKIRKIIKKIWRRLSKKSICIIGVDGTGKTTTIENIQKILTDKAIVQYMGYKNFKTKKAKRYFSSNKKGFVHQLRIFFILYYEMLYRYFECRFSNKIVLFDRYVDEIFINRNKFSKLVYKILFKYMFPRPKIIYYLYCSSESSLSRKDDIEDKDKFKLMKKRFDKELLNNKKCKCINTDIKNEDEVLYEIIYDLNESIIKYII